MKRIAHTPAKHVLAASMVLGFASIAAAGEPYSHSVKSPLPRLTVSGHVDGYCYGGHAATLQESVLRGHADVVRAHGENALNTAEALRSIEAAREHALENKVKRLAVRQQREMMARAHQAEVERLELARRMEVRSAALQAKAEAEAAMTPAEKAEKRERLAAGKLDLARRLAEQGHAEKAQEFMDEIARDYPGTAAAREVSLLIAGQ